MAKKKRASYAETRIIARRGRFHLAHYDDEKGYKIYPPTGIRLDIDPPTDKEGNLDYERKPNWWKKSTHAEDLNQILIDYERERRANYLGIAIPRQEKLTTLIDLPTIEQMMTAYNQANAENRDAPLSDRVIEARFDAINFLLRFIGKRHWTTLTRQDFIDIRTQAREGILINGKRKKYKARSIKTHFGHLRAMYDFAEEYQFRGHPVVAKNPLKEVFVKVERRKIIHITRDDLQTLLTFLYHHKPGLFCHINGQHLLLFRVSDGCKTIMRENINFQSGEFIYWNSKAQREEITPFGKAQELHFRIALAYNAITIKPGEKEPRSNLYPYSHRRTIARYLLHALIYTGIRPIGTHDLKRYGAREFSKAKPDPRTFDLATHHAPTINQLNVESYSGDDLELLHELYVTAQDPVWVPFLESLPNTTWPVPEGKKYVWYYKTREELKALAEAWQWPWSDIFDEEDALEDITREED